MNEAFLQSTTPSNGLNTVLGSIPASSAPAQGTLAAMNPSVQNRVKEPMINPVASYPVMCRPWKNNWQHMLHAGDLIFVNRSDALNQRQNKLQQRFPELVVANLPLLNYLLRTPPPTTPPTSSERALRDIDSWHFLGVMRNDMQVTGTSAYSTNAAKSTKTQAMRLINVDVRGTTRPFNYWQHATVGSHVYLQVVRVDMRNIPDRGDALDTLQNARTSMELYTKTMRTLDAAVRSAPANQRAQKEAERNNYVNTHTCTQVLPVTGGDDYDLLTTDLPTQHDTFVTSDTTSNIPPIYVGWLFQHLGAAEVSKNRASCIWNATQFFDDRFKLPVIPIMMRT